MSNILISNHETGGLRGEIIFGHGLHQEEFIDPFGKKVFRSKFEEVTGVYHNIIPIGGYQYIFDKMFNIGLDQDTTLRVGNLNDEAPQMKIGVPRAEYNSSYYDAECSTSNGAMVMHAGVNIPALNYVFGFMMGDGGSKEDNITAIAPDYKNRGLFRAVPFRMSNDGYDFPEGKYYGKSQTYQSSSGLDPVTSYYIKMFDDPKPRIVHSWVSDSSDELDIVDDTVFASTSSNAIESYVEINLSIDQSDGRGFFTTLDATPRVNEFGLVAGWYNPLKDDFEQLTLISHFVRTSIILSEGDSIEAIYRLYAR
jgi:hypothetical protein